MNIEFVDTKVYHVYVRKNNGKFSLASNVCSGPKKDQFSKNPRLYPAIEMMIDVKTGEVTVKQINEVPTP